MPLSFTVLLFIAMLLAALLLEPMAKRLRIPLSAMLVAGGFAGSWLLVSQGIDTGLRWYHYNNLVFYVFLPALIFDSAFHMDPQLLRRNLVPILLLSVPVVLLSTLLTGTLLFAGIHHPTGFPWISALVAGSLLATSEPFNFSELTRGTPVPGRLRTLMEGESLFSDVTTIVLFMLLLGYATGSSDPGNGWGQAATDFLIMAGGGLIVGGATGLFATLLIRLLDRCAMISLITAWGGYLVAESVFGVSGVMATLASGLIVGYAVRTARQQDALQEVESWWLHLGWISGSMLFLLAGATFTLDMFEERWLAMLTGIGAALFSRWLGVRVAAGAASRLPAQQSIPPGYRTLMIFGSLRGTVTLALALSLPVELEGWWTVQSIAYGVVFFSLFIQAPAIEPLLRRVQARGSFRQ